MKKRILTFVLAVTMIFAIPVAATAEEKPEGTGSNVVWDSEPSPEPVVITVDKSTEIDKEAVYNKFQIVMSPGVEELWNGLKEPGKIRFLHTEFGKLPVVGTTEYYEMGVEKERFNTSLKKIKEITGVTMGRTLDNESEYFPVAGNEKFAPIEFTKGFYDFAGLKDQTVIYINLKLASEVEKPVDPVDPSEPVIQNKVAVKMDSAIQEFYNSLGDKKKIIIDYKLDPKSEMDSVTLTDATDGNLDFELTEDMVQAIVLSSTDKKKIATFPKVGSAQSAPFEFKVNAIEDVKTLEITLKKLNGSNTGNDQETEGVLSSTVLAKLKMGDNFKKSYEKYKIEEKGEVEIYLQVEFGGKDKIDDFLFDPDTLTVDLSILFALDNDKIVGLKLVKPSSKEELYISKDGKEGEYKPFEFKVQRKREGKFKETTITTITVDEIDRDNSGSEKPGPGGTTGGGTLPGVPEDTTPSSNNPTTITDESTPLAEKPETSGKPVTETLVTPATGAVAVVDIQDESVPLAKLPKTNGAGTYGFVTIGGLLAVLGIFLRRKEMN